MADNEIGCLRMINYTEQLTVLMKDIVSRVPTLSFIDPLDVLLFGRFGRSGASGAFATCHCLSLPESEPGYYFWRDRSTGRITRRSEWFVTKSPTVSLDSRQLKYLISFSLPRFCDQSLERSRKVRHYARRTPDWIAKLDTVIHELYHIDPAHNGIRKIEGPDGTCGANCHGPQFFMDVARMVNEYLDSNPHQGVYGFLMHDFEELERQYGGVTAIAFSPYPSYPQRFLERLERQPACADDLAEVQVEPWRLRTRRAAYTADDLHLRQFQRRRSRPIDLKRQVQAA
jgi:hypothetical protein